LARGAPVPGQEFGNLLYRMIRQAREDVGKPSLRIDVVELGGFDEGIGCGGALAANIGPGERIIFPAQGKGTNATLGGVVADLQGALIEVARERCPARCRDRALPATRCGPAAPTPPRSAASPPGSSAAAAQPM